MFIERKNNKIYYDIIGSGQSIILLIHDLGRTSQSVSVLADSLAKRSRVVIVDLCGHGQSSLPGKTVSLKTMARDMIYLFEKMYLGRCFLVGVGFGGAVGLEAYQLRPDLFIDSVFIDTFLTPVVRNYYNCKVRPVDDKQRDKEFRDVFIKWIPAIRDDMFIFATRFDGQKILSYSKKRMLFLYSGIDQYTKKEKLALPEYSNIYLYILSDSVSSILREQKNIIANIIILFLFENRDDFTIDKNSGSDYEDDNNSDLNDLLFF